MYSTGQSGKCSPSVRREKEVAGSGSVAALRGVKRKVAPEATAGRKLQMWRAEGAGATLGRRHARRIRVQAKRPGKTEARHGHGSGDKESQQWLTLSLHSRPSAGMISLGPLKKRSTGRGYLPRPPHGLAPPHHVQSNSKGPNYLTFGLYMLFIFIYHGFSILKSTCFCHS